MTLQDTRPRLTVAQRISPERLGAREFRGPAHPGPSTRSFGGEVPAQAIHAPALTVPADPSLQTAHTWFLRPADTRPTATYRVRAGRARRPFTMHSGEATREHGAT